MTPPKMVEEKIEQITQAELKIKDSQETIEKEVGKESEIYKKIAPSFLTVLENLNKAKKELKDLIPVFNSLEEIKAFILEPVIRQMETSSVSGIRATMKWAILSVLFAVLLIPIQNVFKHYLYSYLAPIPSLTYSVLPGELKQVASLSQVIGFGVPKNFTEVNINPVFLGINPKRGQLKRIWISVPENNLRIERFDGILTPIFISRHSDSLATMSRLVFEPSMSNSIIEAGRTSDQGDLGINDFRFISLDSRVELPMRIIADIEIWPEEFGWFYSLFGKFNAIYQIDLPLSLKNPNSNRVNFKKKQVVY